MFLINAHPTRGRLLEYGRLIERGVYKIITGKRGAFIGDGRLKERGRLLEKYGICNIKYMHLVKRKRISNVHRNMFDRFEY